MHLTKISPWKLFTLTTMAKSKAEKSPWVKKTKKNHPKKKKLHTVKEGKNLAKSDKSSWFGQTPSTILAPAKDPEHLNILGASSLKIKVNVSAGCVQDSLSESGGSDEEKETYPRELISAIRVFLKLSYDNKQLLKRKFDVHTKPDNGTYN